MDVRLTNDGTCISSHDYDARGEFPLQQPGVAGNNLITSLDQKNLANTPMVDRHGRLAKDSRGSQIREQTFTELLEAFYYYLNAIDDNWVNGAPTRQPLRKA